MKKKALYLIVTLWYEYSSVINDKSDVYNIKMHGQNVTIISPDNQRLEDLFHTSSLWPLMCQALAGNTSWLPH